MAEVAEQGGRHGASTAVLAAWLRIDAEPTRLRSDTIAKLMLAGPRDRERSLEIVAEYRAWTVQRLEVVRFNREAVPDPPPNIEAAISWGEALLNAELAWCDRTLLLFQESVSRSVP